MKGISDEMQRHTADGPPHPLLIKRLIWISSGACGKLLFSLHVAQAMAATQVPKVMAIPAMRHCIQLLMMAMSECRLVLPCGLAKSVRAGTFGASHLWHSP